MLPAASSEAPLVFPSPLSNEREGQGDTGSGGQESCEGPAQPHPACMPLITLFLHVFIFSL